MFKLRFQSLAFVLSLVILAGFFGYLRAWTGPTSSPPGSNAPSPVNIGTSDQEKAGRLSATEFYDADNSSFYINPSGDSKVSGTLSLGGDLYDVTNGKKIYDGVAGKFEASVMPYEKGDLTSDWASNTDSTTYYVAPTADKVLCGETYGRGDEGTVCDAGYDCVSSACAAREDICTYEQGPFELNGSNVFCADGKMWSTTLAAGYEWGHYNETTGNCSTHPGDATYPACYACETLAYAGFTDWYLPDKDTLSALWGEDAQHLDCGATNCTSWDTLCCTSAATSPHYYWSSTEYDRRYAWCVYFNAGNVYNYSKPNSFSVRCVRP